MTWTLFKTQTAPAYALAFLLGISALQFFSDLPDTFWLGLLPFFIYISFRNSSFKLLAIMLTGFLWALMHAHWYFLHVLPESMSGQVVLVSGYISDIPKKVGRVQRFTLDVKEFAQAGQRYQPSRIKLSWYDGQDKLLSGQHWQLWVKLKPPHGFINPGGFDYERWLFQNRIHATGYVKKHKDNSLLSDSGIWAIGRIRQYIVNRIQYFTQTYSGLIGALAVGYKGDISTDQWQLLTRTGTSHIMAISGLHIGLVASMVFWITRNLAPTMILKRLPRTYFAALFALIAAAIYALLAGLAIPTQRAMLMLCVVLGSLLYRRQIKPINSLCWALILVLVVDPVSVLSPGFWFSFFAVALIAYCFSGRLFRLTGWQQWGRLQWIIAFGLFPISLFLFLQTSLVAPLANFILIPWVSFIVVPLILFATLSLAVSGLIAQYLYQLAELSLMLIWPVLQTLSNFPVASWQQAHMPFSYLLLAIAGVLVVLAPKGLSHRWLGLIILLPCLLYRTPVPERGQAWIDVLDVGQGLSIVIRTQNHSLVYDTGARFSASFDMGDKVIVPYLKYMGISKLDKLIISHGDNDHIGGAESLIEQINIREITGQGIDRLNHDNKKPCAKGQKWQWDQVNFEFLHPDTSYSVRNNQACVLRIDNGQHDMIITADIESEIEEKLIINYTDKLRSNFMLIPHHGSKTSSTMDFIDAIKAEYAIVSAGYKNKFQHPRPEVLQKYRLSGVKVFNTAEQGAIHINLHSESELSEPESFRNQASHYWNHRPL